MPEIRRCLPRPRSERYVWGLKDPTGKSDDAFRETIAAIAANIRALKSALSE